MIKEEHSSGKDAGFIETENNDIPPLENEDRCSTHSQSSESEKDIPKTEYEVSASENEVHASDNEPVNSEPLLAMKSILGHRLERGQWEVQVSYETILAAGETLESKGWTQYRPGIANVQYVESGCIITWRPSWESISLVRKSLLASGSDDVMLEDYLRKHHFSQRKPRWVLLPITEENKDHEVKTSHPLPLGHVEQNAANITSHADVAPPDENQSKCASCAKKQKLEDFRDEAKRDIDDLLRRMENVEKFIDAMAPLVGAMASRFQDDTEVKAIMNTISKTYSFFQ
jgi:hypothetical protein